MSELLEQMRLTAEEATRAYEAYKAEVVAQELPEVWYLDCKNAIGWHYGDGETACEWWDKDISNDDSCCGRAAMLEHEKVTAAEYNNAKALYHGADFTGRLQDIDLPVCELNQATRDEMAQHTLSEFEGRHNEMPDGEFNRCANDTSHDSSLLGAMLRCGMESGIVYRLRAPKTRPMTRKEAAAWCAWCDRGMVYREKGGAWWRLITAWASDDNPAEMEHAPLHTLNDDGTGGDWEAFEVVV